MKVLVRVLGANVRNNPVMKRWQVRSDLTAIEAWSSVAMLNEIGKPWYKAMMRAIFRPGVWLIVGLRTETPIAARRGVWRKVSKRVVYLHEGRAKTSPIRRLVVLVLEHREAGVQVAFVCTHWVSGAWNRKAKLHKTWRRVKWWVGYRKTDDVIDGLYRDGISSVFYGDLNRVDVRSFHPDMQVIAGQSNIVKMAVLEAPDGAALRVRAVHMDHDVQTDHPMIKARLEMWG